MRRRSSAGPSRAARTSTPGPVPADWSAERAELRPMATVASNPARARDEDAIGTPPASPTLVPAERYYSPAFAALEIERMWPKVWQIACMVDHVAAPGDYFEY